MTECRQVADLVFVVDASGSINDRDPGNWQRIKQFMTRIVDGLDIGPQKTRVAVVTYSNRGNVAFKLDAYDNKDDLKNAILNVRYSGGNTNTSGGLWQMMNLFKEINGARPSVGKTGIVISGGVSTRDTDKTVRYAVEAKQDGVRMIAVGITDQINRQELVGIASEPKSKTVITVDDFDKLPDVIDLIVEETCVVLSTPSPPTTTTTIRTTTSTTLPPARGNLWLHIYLVFILSWTKKCYNIP